MFVRCLLIQTWLLSVAGQLTNRQGFRMTDRLTDTGSPSSNQQYFGAPSGQRISSLYPEYSLRQLPSLQRQDQSQSGAPVLRLSREQFMDNGQPTRQMSPVQSRQQGADRSSGTNQRSFSNLQLARIDPSGRIIPLSPAEREEFIRKGGKLIGPISRQSQSSDRSAQRPSVQSRPSTAANNRMTNSNNFMGFNRASNVYDNFLYPSVDQRRTPSSFIQNPYPRDSSWRSPQTARDRDNALRREWVEQQDVLERQRISQKKEEELQKALNLQREIDLKNSLQEKNQPATSDLTGADLPATKSPQLLYTTTPPPVETSTPAAEQTSTVAISAPSAVISAPSAVVAAPSAGGTDQPNLANPVIQANPVLTAVESRKVESSTTSQPTTTTQQVVTTEAPINSIKVVIPGSMTTDTAYSANNSSSISSSSIQRADSVVGVSADTNTWTQTTASVSTPLQGTGVITNRSKADPAVTATSGYEAKVNELIRQMAIDMLLSRIKQSQVQTSPAGFDSQLAAELIRLLGGGNVTVAPTLVLPSSSSQGPALQVPTTTSKADTTETTTGAPPVTPPALTSGNVYTPPEKNVTVQDAVSTPTPVSRSPAVNNFSLQLASLAQNVIEALLQQSFSGVQSHDGPLVRAANVLLGEIRTLTGSSGLSSLSPIGSILSGDLLKPPGSSSSGPATSLPGTTARTTGALLSDAPAAGNLSGPSTVPAEVGNVTFDPITIESLNVTSSAAASNMTEPSTTTPLPATEPTEAVPTEPTNIPPMIEALPGMDVASKTPPSQNAPASGLQTMAAGDATQLSLVNMLSKYYGISLPAAQAIINMMAVVKGSAAVAGTEGSTQVPQPNAASTSLSGPIVSAAGSSNSSVSGGGSAVTSSAVVSNDGERSGHGDAQTTTASSVNEIVKIIATPTTSLYQAVHDSPTSTTSLKDAQNNASSYTTPQSQTVNSSPTNATLNEAANSSPPATMLFNEAVNIPHLSTATLSGNVITSDESLSSASPSTTLTNEAVSGPTVLEASLNGAMDGTNTSYTSPSKPVNNPTESATDASSSGTSSASPTSNPHLSSSSLITTSSSVSSDVHLTSSGIEPSQGANDTQLALFTTTPLPSSNTSSSDTTPPPDTTAKSGLSFLVSSLSKLASELAARKSGDDPSTTQSILPDSLISGNETSPTI